MPQPDAERPLGPPEDPDRFEDFDECVDALQEDEDLSKEEAERICGAWENTSSHAMSDTDDPQHRAYHQPDPDRVELRQEDAEDGVFVVRMPLATTGEVRNEGDEPLTRDEIDGMARQIEERSIGVFLDHGSNVEISGSRYSATGKVGEWTAPEVESREAADELVADARLMDPETLPAASGAVREALAVLKEQVKRGIPLSSSIGWRDAEDFPGGNDLMEGSIVGIPADPRTTSEHASPTAMARAAVDAGADPETFLEELRDVVMAPERDADEPTVTDDSDTSDEPDAAQSEDTTDEQTEREAPDWADEMLELQREMNESVAALADAIREDDEDDDDDMDDEDDDEENAADEPADGDEPDETASVTVDGEEYGAADIRELREQLADAEPAQPDPDPDETQAAEADESDTTDDTDTRDRADLFNLRS